MRAVQFRSTNGPSDAIVADVAAPVRKPHEVLIDVAYAGVSFPDVLQSKGEYQIQPPTPYIPGAEVSGVVVEAPEGSGLTVGQRVSAFPGFGGFAEQVSVPVPLVLPLPDGVGLDQGAAVPLNYLTTVFALLERGGLQAGESVLVQGAAGGIGTAAIQIARAVGARTIAVVSTPEKGEVARAAGADDVVLADGFKDAVKELTGGRGVDVVVDPVGGDRFTDSLRGLAPLGRLLVIGFTEGSIPQVKVNRLLLNNVDVRGVGWGAFWMADRVEVVRQQWDSLLELFPNGLSAPIGARFGLEGIVDALTTIEQRQAMGKVLLEVAGG
ncbi:NADPH:quinone oxidoreductase family protein [Calidifontibacter terrae]